MRLIKISPKFQITIPQEYRHILTTNWISISEHKKTITLHPIEIQEAKSEDQILKEIFKQAKTPLDN